jgi:hypothetical protein
VRWQLVRVDQRLVFDEELKTPKSKGFVSLPAPVVEVLRRHKAAQAAERLAAPVWQPWPGHDDLVFPTQIGTPTDPRNALRAIVGIAERAGLTGATVHTLRHSTGSALIASGTHMEVVQEVLRHSSYAHHGGHLQPCSHRAAAGGRRAARGGVSVVTAPVATLVATFRPPGQVGWERNMLSLAALRSGWRDLNSRPLDPQIGPRRLSSVNHLSLVSIVDR